MNFNCVTSCREPLVLQSSSSGFSSMSGSRGVLDCGTSPHYRGRKFSSSQYDTSLCPKTGPCSSFGKLRTQSFHGVVRNGADEWWSWDPLVLVRAQSSAAHASEGRETGRKQDSSVKLEDDDGDDDDIDFVDEDIVGSSLSQPSRGELFLKNALERQKLRAERQAALNQPMQRQDLRKRDKTKILRAPGASCYGCGAGIQCLDPESPGFISSEIFELKKRHRQLKDFLCGRCHLLSQGQMIAAVSGHGGYGNGKGFVSAEVLRSQLSHLRNNKALILKLVDITDFNGSFLTRVRDLVGANPIILAVTKVDLLPKGTDLGVIGDWVVECILRKKLNVISVHLTSSKALTGISGVAANIQRQRQGRDVYVLGSANVGKSAFISALLKEMSSRDPVALAAQRRKPIQSAMPGTTLGPIEIKAFSGGGSLYDTPGVHLHHRMAAAVHPDDLPQIAPRRRLRGSVVLAPSLCESDDETEGLTVRNVEGDLTDVSQQGTEKDGSFRKKAIQFDGRGSFAGTSLFWGGLVRIDVVQAPAGARLRFYGPPFLQVIMVPTAEADDFYAEEVGKILCPPTALDKPNSWSGLSTQHTVCIPLQSGSMPGGDVAISGLGWITAEYPNTDAFMDISGDDRIRLRSQVQMVVHVPKAVEVCSRPPMPVGVNGPDWYKYSDISDDELDNRPRFFF